ncbi:MAG: L,D-transpeptidase family protein, partial [Pseudomonadota bacterium]
MNFGLRLFIGLSFVTAAASTPTQAVEPEAPKQLLTENEARLIGLGMRLDRMLVRAPQQERQDYQALASFYASKEGRLLWVRDGRISARAKSLFKEFENAGQWGLRAKDFRNVSLANAADGRELSSRALLDLEVKTSLTLLKYARHARGGRMELQRLSLDFDRRPPLLKPSTVLVTAAGASDIETFVQNLHPKHEQFHLLRKAYLATLADERVGKVTTRAVSSKSRKKRRVLRRRLSERLLINMEMWRWMPEKLGSRHIWANIPEYQVRVVNGDRIAHRERMIVGKTKHKTPIFSDELETVVFRPFWNVPNSIKVKELLPKLLRGGTLNRQNLKLALGKRVINPTSVNWATTDIRKFHVYQPPGRRNALGQVKFLFPNKHAVYFHDTPTKHLFKRKTRAFSHGCMRVRHPLKLAEVLLGMDKGWTGGRINSLANKGRDNNSVRLRSKIPVHVTYFTAHVETSGRIRTFADVYGHERLVKLGMEGRTAKIATPKKENLDEARKRVVARAGGRSVRISS